MPSRPDDEEFRRATADVEPLRAPRRVQRQGSPPAPLAEQRRRDERAALAESLSGRLSVDDAIDSGITFLESLRLRLGVYKGA